MSPGWLAPRFGVAQIRARQVQMAYFHPNTFFCVLAESCFDKVEIRAAGSSILLQNKTVSGTSKAKKKFYKGLPAYYQHKIIYLSIHPPNLSIWFNPIYLSIYLNLSEPIDHSQSTVWMYLSSII